jgi:signal transduction histidine kinase
MSASPLGRLRGKLLASYVLALVLALAAFGGAAVFAIDWSLRASLDQRLQTTARAALNFVDVKHGRVEIDARDRRQLSSILEPQTDVAIVRNAADVVFSTKASPPDELLGSVPSADGFLVFRQAGATSRTLVLPIDSGSKRIGAVAVWAPTQWVAETDIRVAAAFVLAALLLAGVASIAGAAVTRQALEDALARQRRFTADASHELRAPLSVIRAEADLALQAPRDAATYQEAMRIIASEADRMESLVSALLSAARAENTRGKRTAFDLQELAQRVCSRLKPAADAKSVVIALHQSEACSVIGNAEALESAVIAVLHNAIRFSPLGRRIDVVVARDRSEAELSVRDEGPGFTHQALDRALEWFWSDDPARKRESSGLGLAIADSIARANGGRVMLSNAPGGGARVQFSFPAR